MSKNNWTKALKVMFILTIALFLTSITFVQQGNAQTFRPLPYFSPFYNPFYPPVPTSVPAPFFPPRNASVLLTTGLLPLLSAITAPVAATPVIPPSLTLTINVPSLTVTVPGTALASLIPPAPTTTTLLPTLSALLLAGGLGGTPGGGLVFPTALGLTPTPTLAAPTATLLMGTAITGLLPLI